MNLITSFASGLIFAIGLSISGMVNPQKVIGFLDIFGKWDPALIFVMGGAVIFNGITFKLIKKKSTPYFDTQFHWPTLKDVDVKLISGATMFGIGWGLVGICPGPAIVNLAQLDLRILAFLASMITGMFIFKLFFKPTC